MQCLINSSLIFNFSLWEYIFNSFSFYKIYKVGNILKKIFLYLGTYYTISSLYWLKYYVCILCVHTYIFFPFINLHYEGINNNRKYMT